MPILSVLFAIVRHLILFYQDRGRTSVSCIEFLRYIGRDEESQRKAVELMNIADQVIFLDIPDQRAALAFAKTLQTPSSSSSSSSSSIELAVMKKIEDATIIPVPSTTPTTRKEWSKRPSNVISFGTIRRGKGLPHLIKLAELFKQADEKKEAHNKRNVIIAGSMEPHFYVEGFTDAMKRIFPTHLDEISVLENAWLLASKSKDKANKDKLVSAVTMQIRDKITEWQNNTTDFSLPVKFYFDTKPEQVPELFEQARYSFLPAYRGFTLRNTSISTSLDSGCVTYAHETNISPYRFPQDPSSPIVLILGVVSEFEQNPSFDKFEYADKNGSLYAINVFKDIEQRDSDPYPTMTKTLPAVKKLVEETISLEKITHDMVKVYEKAGVTFKPTMSLTA